MTPYEFVLLRYVPNMTSGEFANIGVVLFDRAEKQLRFRLSDRVARVSHFFGNVDSTAYRRLVKHVNDRLESLALELDEPSLLGGEPDSIEALIERAFGEAGDCFQVSNIMSGLARDTKLRASALFEEFVGRYELEAQRPKREESEVRKELTQVVSRAGLSHRVLLNYRLAAPDFSHEFHLGWMNGQRQVADAISFDLVDPQRIVEKASHWTGRMYLLARGEPFAFTCVVAPPSEPTLENAFTRALSILRSAPNVRQAVVDREVQRLAQLIADDVASSDDEDSSSPYSEG